MSNGWVAIRRGIGEHLREGKLTPNEYIALIQLILDANAETGGYNVNGPLLMYRCGYIFNLDTAQRILNRLHKKRYIWYRAARNTHNTRQTSPYWINRYQLTKGEHRLRYTNLSELFDKSTICQQDVWDRAAQTTAQTTAPLTAPLADKYYKGQGTIDNNNNTTINIETSASVNTSEKASKTHSETESSNTSMLTTRAASLTASRECVTGDVTGDVTGGVMGGVMGTRHEVASRDASRTAYASPETFTWGDPVPTLRFECGESPGYYCLSTGSRIPYFDDVLKILRKGTQ